jgi:anti-anti-sigma regulatory factor
LSELTFMDSTGLASIITAVNRANGRGAGLQIARPLPAQPYRLLELTGIMARLSFTPHPPGDRS